MIIFTSISANYIPKATVLAKSFKKHNKGLFVLCLVERSIHPAANDPIFDYIITPDELNIPQLELFMFKHSVVEACTAVKGYCFKKLFEKFPDEKVFVYLDPDILVTGEFIELSEVCKENNIVLTPHLCVPEETLDAIIDNEICSLKHGVFNLGFLAIRRSEDAVRFINWWTDRLHEFCWADFSRGLFTDQRWVDLAPCFFDVYIFRHPGYNVATWNLTHRPISQDDNGNFYAAEAPLRFYHFSGFDSGANEIMHMKYCPDKNNPLYDLRKHYIELLKQNGQNELGDTPWSFDFYNNGKKIKKKHREAYRFGIGYQSSLQDPFNAYTSNVFFSYFLNRRTLAYKTLNILSKIIFNYKAGGFRLIYEKVLNRLNLKNGLIAKKDVRK